MRGTLKKIFVLSFVSISLSGCSTIWSGVSEFADIMAEETEFLSLRGLLGSSEKSVQMADTTTQTDVYKTEVGMYIPQESSAVTFDSDGNAIVDTSPHPCPESTYLTEENACMYLETETFSDSFAELGIEETVPQPVDTSPHPCPEGTYMTADNSCMYLETETFDFTATDMAVTDLAANTMIECPDGTYLDEDNLCMSFE